MTIKCELEQVENGFVFSYEDEEDENTKIAKQEVFEYGIDDQFSSEDTSWKVCAICGKEFRDNHKYLYCSDECAKTMQKTCGHKEEKDALIKLLYRVCEHFGYFYQKYEKNNINITYKKGHKLE